MNATALDALYEQRDQLERWYSRLPHQPTPQEKAFFEEKMAEIRRKCEIAYSECSKTRQNTFSL